MKLAELTLRMVRVPLIRPYVLSYRTFTEFEPVIVEVRDADGRIGWVEGHISPGSSSETREGGWSFLTDMIKTSLGRDTEDLAARALARFGESKVAVTLLVTAVEVLERHPDPGGHPDQRLRQRRLDPVGADQRPRQQLRQRLTS